MDSSLSPVIEIQGLDFAYKGNARPVLRGLTLTILPGWRCLLIGANGAGKTTLLGILAGQHMIEQKSALVLGRPAFHDTSLASEVTFLGGEFPFHSDIRVADMLAPNPEIDPKRQEHLIDILGVDPSWRMHQVSAGQRRRVQLLLGLRRFSRVLLLDEITTDLDVVGRTDLLAFLKRESEERGVTVLYATHILDGLEDWATHLAFLEDGEVRVMSELSALTELRELRESGASAPLFRLAERWLRKKGPRG